MANHNIKLKSNEEGKTVGLTAYKSEHKNVTNKWEKKKGGNGNAIVDDGQGAPFVRTLWVCTYNKHRPLHIVLGMPYREDFDLQGGDNRKMDEEEAQKKKSFLNRVRICP